MRRLNRIQNAATKNVSIRNVVLYNGFNGTYNGIVQEGRPLGHVEPYEQQPRQHEAVDPAGDHLKGGVMIDDDS